MVDYFAISLGGAAFALLISAGVLLIFAGRILSMSSFRTHRRKP